MSRLGHGVKILKLLIYVEKLHHRTPSLLGSGTLPHLSAVKPRSPVEVAEDCKAIFEKLPPPNLIGTPLV